MEDYINELFEEHKNYLQENTELTKETIKEMVPETVDMSEEDKKKNAELMEKVFYLLTLEYQIRGALGILELLKTKIELPQHAEAIN